MVVSLGPGKFYGSSLPRPRIYTDVKFSDDRVDPPVSVLDPLLTWANEAHWSMGGLSFKRLRLQGRIEGSVKKLQAERDSLSRKMKRLAKLNGSPDVKASEGKGGKKRAASLTPLRAPIASKRRRYMAVSDEEEEETDEEEEDVVLQDESESDSEPESSEEEKVVEEVVLETKKKPVRKLYDEFNKVARESKRIVESNRVGSAVMKVVGEMNKDRSEKGKSGSIGGTRTSPRLVKVADGGSVAPSKTRASRRLVKRG